MVLQRRVGRWHLPAGPVRGGHRDPPRVGGDCRDASIVAPAGRGVPDRGRRSPVADPAPRTGGPGDGAVPRAPRNEGRWGDPDPGTGGGCPWFAPVAILLGREEPR